MSETVDKCKKLALPGQGDAFAEQMLDIHGERLEIMTKYNVELFVLSLASPGPQGEPNKEKAEVSSTIDSHKSFFDMTCLAPGSCAKSQ